MDQIEIGIVSLLAGSCASASVCARSVELRRCWLSASNSLVKRVGLHRVGGAQELVGELGMGHPAGSIDAWRNAERDRGRINVARG